MKRVSATELAIAMCPKKAGMLSDSERAFWISRAEIALGMVENKGFWHARLRDRLAALLRLRARGRPKVESGGLAPAQKRGVRLSPLPEGCPQPLASVIGAAVAGAIRDCLNAHPMPLSNQEKGLLIGSSRKRAVNQLTCAEGRMRLRWALEGEE